MKSTNEIILDVARDLGRPITKEDLMPHVDLTEGSLDNKLSEMARDGELVRLKRGIYDLPENVEDAEKPVSTQASMKVASRGDGETVGLPLVSIRINAGEGEGLFEERIPSYMSFDREQLTRQTGADPARLVVLPISGNSMEPLISPGDFVIVERMNGGAILDGVIYVFRHSERGAIIKRAYWENEKTLRLTSDNTAGPEIRVTPDDGMEWECVGKFIRVIKAV